MLLIFTTALKGKYYSSFLMRISDPRWFRNLSQRRNGICLRSCNRFSVLACEGRGGKCQKVGFERSPGACVINTKLHYRKGLRFILKQNTFVHLFLCLCTYSFIKYIYIEDFKQHTEIIHWVSKNDSERREKMRERIWIRLAEQTSVNLGKH